MCSVTTCRAISFGLVGCMSGAAWSEYEDGAQLADIHLIAPAPLAPGTFANGTFNGSSVHGTINGSGVYLAGSSVVGSSVASISTGVHESAIIEAQYLEPVDTAPLRLDGLSYARQIAWYTRSTAT